MTKPIGFDNFKTFSFVSGDGSGFTFFRKASFTITETGLHKVYAGPNITSVSSATDAVITTAEAHGFHTGQSIRLYGLPALMSALNTTHVITVLTTTTFQIDADTSGTAAVSGVGIAGVDLAVYIPEANYSVVPGANCMDSFVVVNAWDLPLVG